MNFIPTRARLPNMPKALSEPVEPNLRGHVPALDAIRGLAILAVTVYRFGGGSHDEALAAEKVIPFIELGSRGVDLFFVLSGFLITGILFDTKQDLHFFRNFYARRTVRIFPLYYGVLIVALLLWPWHIPAQDYASWLWLYGANIVQAREGWCLGWLNHFWSLAVEEHFYLVWPAVIYLLSRRNAMLACVGLFVASAVGRVACAYLYPHSPAAEVLTIFRLDGLVAGSYLALAARETGGLRALARPAWIIFLATSVLLVPFIYKGTRFLTIPETLWAIEGASFLVLVLTAVPESMLARFGENRILHWFGKYSYGMYVHQNLLIPLLSGFITAGGLATYLGNAVVGQLAYLVMMSLATVAVAYLSWHGFEVHFLKLKKYFGGHA
jgi:peptidoglycan/LPS O-acetylase OafA/YrhL